MTHYETFNDFLTGVSEGAVHIELTNFKELVKNEAEPTVEEPTVEETPVEEPPKEEASDEPKKPKRKGKKDASVQAD